MNNDNDSILEKYLEILEEARNPSYGDVNLSKRHKQVGPLRFGLGAKEAEPDAFAGKTTLTPEFTKQSRSDKTYESIMSEELNDPSFHIAITGPESILSKKSQNTFSSMKDQNYLQKNLSYNKESDDILVPYFELPRTIGDFFTFGKNESDENIKKALAEFLTKTLNFLKKEDNYRKVYTNANNLIDNTKYKEDYKENITNPADTYSEHIGDINESLKGLKKMEFVDPKLEPSFYKLRSKTFRGGRDIGHAINPLAKYEGGGYRSSEEREKRSSLVRPTERTGRTATNAETKEDILKRLNTELIRLKWRKAPESEIEALTKKIRDLSAPPAPTVTPIQTPTKKKPAKKPKKKLTESFIRDIPF